MKVLLVIFNYKAGFPFVHDLEDNLKKQGIDVDVLDSDRLFVKRNDAVQQLIPLGFLRKIINLPKIGAAVRIFTLKRFLYRQRGRYDAVNVHSCDPIYIHLAKDLSQVSPNFYPMIWGSDFYRANDNLRERKRKIFDYSRFIIFANPVNTLDFTSYYNNYKEKSIITGFGVAKFDLIKKIRQNQSVEEIKKFFGLPQDQIIVSVGYNGTIGQQHEKLLRQLSVLNDSIKRKIFLVLQMTYGYEPEYAKNIETIASETGVNFKMITNFLNDEQTSKLRLAIDVVLNAQISDGFSSSIQEHIFAGNIVVVGDWLPYKPLELANIFYYKRSLEKFSSTLVEIVEHYHEIKPLTNNNADKIYDISSWSSRIKNWISIYKGEGAKFLYNENEMSIK